MSLKITAIALALAAALAAAGCTKTIAEKAIEGQTGGKVKVDSKKGSVEIKTKTGTVNVGQKQIPKDFPGDVPVYKPSRVLGSLTNTLEGKKSFVITLKTGDDAEEIADYYKSKLPGNGWTEKSSLSGGDGATKFASLAHEKGGMVVTVGVTRDSQDKESQIVISVNPKSSN